MKFKLFQSKQKAISYSPEVDSTQNHPQSQLNINKYLLWAFICFVFSGCTTMQRHPGKDASSLTDVCLKNNLTWQWDSVGQIVNFRYREAKATAMVDSEIVLVNGQAVTLSSPLRLINSMLFVPSDFKERVISRLMDMPTGKSVEEFNLNKIKTIIVDAGHGGHDPGAIGHRGLKEKEVVLDISVRLRRILEKKGFKVIMTRTKDVFVTLPQRTEIASKSNADLFVSIHANSNPKRSVSGLEVYSSKDLNMKDKNEDQRVTNHRLFYQHKAMDRNSDDVEKIISDMLYINKQEESPTVAATVATDTSRFAKAKGRGRKLAGFFVLRNTLIPAILVEVGFVTNLQEEKYLRSGSYRQQIAQGIANSLFNYAEKP